MNSRVFELADQTAFANLSGDWNPLHLDPVFARRRLIGQIVVHGIHAIFWVLENWLAVNKKPVVLKQLQARFSRPIPIGSIVAWNITASTSEHLGIAIDCAGSRAIDLDIDWAAAGIEHKWAPASVSVTAGRACRRRSMDDLLNANGNIQLGYDKQGIARHFPNIDASMPPGQACILLASSRLVGIECPGINALFSELNLSFAENTHPPTLSYQVTKTDPRFHSLQMDLGAPGSKGTIKAFCLPEPQSQNDYLSIRAAVAPGEFTNQHALIVGGSRGLGELVAKILAAGGASTRITFKEGEGDAERVAREIAAGGGEAGHFQFDIEAAAKNIRASLGNWLPSHVYYFATPFIFSGQKGRFSPSLFKRFCDYYVTGLASLVAALKTTVPLHVFYPSSVAIDEVAAGMSEYAAAKCAGEYLCASLEKEHPGSVFFCPRLPRMATDQTLSILPVKNSDPLPVLLELTKAFRDKSDCAGG